MWYTLGFNIVDGWQTNNPILPDSIHKSARLIRLLVRTPWSTATMHHVLPRDDSCEAPYQWYVCDLNGFRGCCSDTSVCDSKQSTCPIENLPPDERPSLSADSRFTGTIDYETDEATPISTTLISTPSHTPQDVSGPSTSTDARHSTTITVGGLGGPTSTKRSPDRSSTTTTANGSLRGSSKTPIIAGTVGGVVGVIMMVAAIGFLCVWLRRRRNMKKEEKRMLGYYVAPATQQIDSDYLPATGGEGRFKAALKRASFVSSLTSSRFTTHRRSPLSPLSPLQDQKEDAPYSDRPTADTHPELAGTLQDITAELSSEATSNGRYELAPDPERSLINSPRHSNSSPTKSDFTGSSAAGYSGSLVGPNLNATRNRQSTTENSAGSNPHVMSWMNYHPDASKNQ